MAQESVKLGWLHDSGYGNANSVPQKFAPNTILSQVLTADATPNAFVMTGAAGKNSLTTTQNISILYGGTGATTAAEARTNLGLGNVENIALSTWTGTSNITTLGTIATGTWHGTTIAANYVGDLPANKITSGTFDFARMPNMYWANVAVSSSSSTTTAPTVQSIKAGTITIGGSASPDSKTIDSNDTLYLKSATNKSILFQPNATSAARFDTSGYFRPETDGGSQLGTSSYRWAKLYVGSANSYGGSTTAPIYWNAGVPTAITSVDIAHGGTGATTAMGAKTNLLAATGNGRIFYGTCTTAAATAAKIVTCTSYDALTVGDVLVVDFSYTNEAAVGNLTLNVNSKGAKSIKKHYSSTAANNLNAVGMLTNSIHTFVYDGNYWILIDSDYNTNTNTLLRTYASGTNIWLPLIASSSAASTTANYTNYTTSYKDWYGAVPDSEDKQVFINPSTGYMKIKSGCLQLGKHTLNSPPTGLPVDDLDNPTAKAGSLNLCTNTGGLVELTAYLSGNMYTQADLPQITSNYTLVGFDTSALSVEANHGYPLAINSTGELYTVRMPLLPKPTDTNIAAIEGGQIKFEAPNDSQVGIAWIDYAMSDGKPLLRFGVDSNVICYIDLSRGNINKEIQLVL